MNEAGRTVILTIITAVMKTLLSRLICQIGDFCLTIYNAKDCPEKRRSAVTTRLLAAITDHRE